ncbi:Uncharacterised protein [BD1-7 clade bacterium]|uniref:Uncharacterized protein n=1 Tax=BD1-7 clade bacterium TaxID=2029982 RepID=A0A5S9PBF2_9GAMM|nr:Uncharacterised protein [BD1-7 clade bacterium]
MLLFLMLIFRHQQLNKYVQWINKFTMLTITNKNCKPMIKINIRVINKYFRRKYIAEQYYIFFNKLNC